MKLFSPLALAALLLLAACRPGDDRQEAADHVGHEDYLTFGETVAEDRPSLDPADVARDPLTYNGQTVRVEGNVAAVCDRPDCWILLEDPTGYPIRVDAPRDAAGMPNWTFPEDAGVQRVIIEGIARADSLSADDLHELAQLTGRPQAGQLGDVVEQDGQLSVYILATGALVERPQTPARPTGATPGATGATPADASAAPNTPAER